MKWKKEIFKVELSDTVINIKGQEPVQAFKCIDASDSQL